MAVVVSAAPVTGQRIEIVTFVPSQIMCAETPMPGTGVVMSLPVVVNRYGPAIQSAPALVLRYDFVIDADGRTRTIRRTATASTPGYYVNTSDIAPSLAVSRFPAGDPRSKCSITYTGSTVPIDAAPLQLLYELASRPETEGTVGTVYDRLRPVGSDCMRGPGQYRRLNLPAFEKIARPGSRTPFGCSVALATKRWTALARVRCRTTATNQELASPAVRIISTALNRRSVLPRNFLPMRLVTTGSSQGAWSIRPRSLHFSTAALIRQRSRVGVSRAWR